jgi:hypothetical protein
MPFLLSEDIALKQRMQGMFVRDGNSAHRSVGVWFGQPDKELRAQNYPYVIVNLLGINPAYERFHSANPVSLEYLTPPVPVGPGQTLLYDRPIPVNIDYQVTAYSRHPHHDRSLMAQMLRRLPMQGGLIAVTHDDEDVATARRLDFLRLDKRDRSEDNKRLFTVDFTVRISSEMEPDRYALLMAPPTRLAMGLGANTPRPAPQDPDTPQGVETASASGEYLFDDDPAHYADTTY